MIDLKIRFNAFNEKTNTNRCQITSGKMAVSFISVTAEITKGSSNS